MWIALDIDATGLDPEDNELPVNLRSPKASPNTVLSPLAKEKRMPFFKKVNWGAARLLLLSVRRPAPLDTKTPAAAQPHEAQVPSVHTIVLCSFSVHAAISMHACS